MNQVGIDHLRALPVAPQRHFIAGRFAPIRDGKKTLLAFADLVEKHALELAVLRSRDNGAEIGMH